MEELNLKELLDYVKNKRITIILIILFTLIIGSTYSLFFKVPKYKSTTKVVLVNASDKLQEETTQADVTLNKSLVTTYSEIAKSEAILERAIKNLELDYSVKSLENNVTVSNVTNTEIIQIDVVDKDSKQSAKIANEIVKVFNSEIKKIYKLQNVSTIVKAKEPDSAYNISMKKDLIIYILVGLALSLGFVFVLFYFDTTVKNSDEIENKLGLPIIGIVPKVKR